MKWAEICDLLRAQVVGLPTNAGVFVFSSLEAALIEISFLLADREREVGGARTQILYGLFQDPALERMAKALSSSGLDAKPKTSDELRDVATWFPEVKAQTLLLAFAESDRFTGQVFDSTAVRTTVLADGVRAPVLTMVAGGWNRTLPRPFEIRLSEVGGVAVAIAGERLRLDPRMAPVSLDENRLLALQTMFADSKNQSAKNVSAESAEEHQSHVEKARHEIEAFESALPKPFRAWWPKGHARVLDRAIFTSAEHDGSWVLDQIRPKLQAAGVSKDLVENGLFALSGCLTQDERRQEWLRARGDDPWAIRGCVHISVAVLRALQPGDWARIMNISPVS